MKTDTLPLDTATVQVLQHVTTATLTRVLLKRGLHKVALGGSLITAGALVIAAL